MMLSWFILQIQFLTRIPVPIKVEFDENKFARSIILAPIIGLLVGAIITGVYFLSMMSGHKALAALFVVISEIILTSGLHLDGLADTFDGIFSNRPKKQILEIMRDPRIGTNGTLAIVLTIITKLILIFLIKDDLLMYSLIFMSVLSRMNIIWAAGISNYARKGDGLAKSIVNHCGLKEVLISSVIALVICALFMKFIILIAFPVSIFFAVIITQYSNKKIGGITGDVIGAVIELSEIAILFSFVIIGNIK